MEVVAILLPAIVAPVVVLAAATGAVTRRPRPMAIAVSWLLFGTTALVGPWIPKDTGTPDDDLSVTVAVANTLATNEQHDDVVADVLAQDPDVVVVPEATKEIHDRLAAEFEHALRREAPYTAAIGVYGDVPLELTPLPPGLVTRDRAARIIVDDRFVLWALHLPRPWITPRGDTWMRPGGHARTLDRFLDRMEREELPVVVAGDLNLTDRGRGYRKITSGRRDAMRGIVGRPTSVKATFRPLLLRIDHVLVPNDWCADEQRRFDLTGSDHKGVAARIGPCTKP